MGVVVKIMKRLGYIVLPTLSIALLLIGWVALAGRNDEIPNPLEVFNRYLLLQEHPISKISMPGHIWASLKRVLQAWGYSILLGIPFGLMIGWSKIFGAYSSRSSR